MLPSYAPAPTTYKAKKISDGANLLNLGMPRRLTMKYATNPKAKSHIRFSIAANALDVLVTSPTINGLKRKVEVM